MTRTTVNERAQAWVVDYSAARKQAIRWLGDRYLLAKPINARQDGSRTPNPQTFEDSDLYPAVSGRELKVALTVQAAEDSEILLARH